MKYTKTHAGFYTSTPWNSSLAGAQLNPQYKRMATHVARIYVWNANKVII